MTSAVPLHGVKASYLASLFSRDQTAGKTTDDVVRYLIKPLTRNMSLADFLLADSKLKHNVKDVAVVFVSHAWMNLWTDLMEALATDISDPFVWLDVVSINQHQPDSAVSYDSFHEAMKQFGRAQFVMTPWSHPLLVKRSWPVWEIYGVVKFNIPFKAIMAPKEKEDFFTQLRAGILGNDFFQDLFASVDVEKACSENPEVQRDILRDVRAIGVRQVNDIILSAVKKWLVSFTEEAALNVEAESVTHGNVISAIGNIYFVTVGEDFPHLYYEKH